MLNIGLPDSGGIGKLENAIFRLLEEVGMVFQNQTILRALEAWGARVDHSQQVATFPRTMLVEFVEEIRQEEVSPDSCVFRAPTLPSVTGSVAQFIYDDEQQGPRPGCREDLVRTVKLGNALHPQHAVGHALLLTDVPPEVEPLEAALVLAEYADVPGPPFAWDVRQLPYLDEMGHTIGIDRWYSLGAVCMAHPLRFDRNVADRYVHMMRDSLCSAGLTSMPVAGVSAPVTVEGFIVITAAEFLGAWIAGRALNPQINLGGDIWAGTTDMRTGHVSYSAFDALFYSAATLQFLRAWCGVGIKIGGGEYSASKVPGSYAALEKAYKALAIAAFTGEHPTIGQGMLDNGKVFSAVQLILDREFGLGAKQFAREIAPTEENITLDTIIEVGRGNGGSHMIMDHTASRFRDSLWLPRLISRMGWTGSGNEAALMEQCQEEARRLTEGARRPEGREDALEAMRGVVEKAKDDLLC